MGYLKLALSKWVICLTLLMVASHAKSQQDRYVLKQGTISFLSDAPLERIEATSNSPKGLIDLSQQTFAFTLSVESFEGFNSALQQEHFFENYMETKEFPKASFTGKLIDRLDQNTSKQTARAKGELILHGIKQERIISVNVERKDNGFQIQSTFNVKLKDHQIIIPKIVHQKISEIISVEIAGFLSPQAP